MNILIAVASKHGSTQEIAEAIGRHLRAAGHTVDVHRMEEATAVAGYDAAIIGSAVYMGQWLSPAKEFVDRNQSQLAALPVWLFSSGPLGAENPQPQGDPEGIEELMKKAEAAGHRVFVGKLDKSSLGMGERLIVKMVKAPEGDFRDWEEIRAWTAQIAQALPAPAIAGT